MESQATMLCQQTECDQNEGTWGFWGRSLSSFLEFLGLLVQVLMLELESKDWQPLLLGCWGSEPSMGQASMDKEERM